MNMMSPGIKKPVRSASVLFCLKEARGKAISSGRMANVLGISRTAVWKQIQSLKKYGYVISAENNGYQLQNSPDLLLPEEIQYTLGTSVFGKKIVYFLSIDSTNDYAKKIALQGAPHGTVVIAEEQRKGKGRLGRHWFSPGGKNIYLSLILRPSLLPQEAYKLTMVAGVSVVEAIEKETDVPVKLKWPNDVVVERKSFLKVGGILTEMSAESDRINFAVLGIGLNVNMAQEEWPPELRRSAFSLKEAVGSGNNLSRVSMLREMLRSLERNYQLIGGRWDEIYDTYCSMEIVTGKEISVQQGKERWTGKVVAIDSDGALVLKTKQGMQRIVAGDVTILKQSSAIISK